MQPRNLLLSSKLQKESQYDFSKTVKAIKE